MNKKKKSVISGRPRQPSSSDDCRTAWSSCRPSDQAAADPVRPSSWLGLWVCL